MFIPWKTFPAETETQEFVLNGEAANSGVREGEFEVSCTWFEMGLAISSSTRPKKLFNFPKPHFPVYKIALII